MGSFLGVTAVQWQNGTRVAVGVVILASLGLTLAHYTQIDPRWDIVHPEAVSNGLQASPADGLLRCSAGTGATHACGSRAARWSAITVILVASPLVGAVAKTGIERTIGTIAGGLLAMGAVYANSLPLLCVLAFAATLVGYLAGAKYGREYSGKLFPLTYLIVGSAGVLTKEPIPIMLARITGILLGAGADIPGRPAGGHAAGHLSLPPQAAAGAGAQGIVCMFVLSMVWFPRSASDKVRRERQPQPCQGPGA
ncbi:hypothetical protein MNEG_6276 [Monoraphidium neglectum]|uniref:Integral membrane bound transporter domain-containing protein n=1 Tax=Monoraphidium neglectum TaxID=145388 RepID=A0A0D2JRT4_9CHLO|nr:hypothetical protein MNEG_6276 [Monoraphidium neglectum]KIZ01688.1 hypothetical protein MNEG_6276 [Monoraphidium neglectum]|eukprot:XP_013900707.1 hypothetical protein MNEG_6276 [Monoraphidium neglectum]